MGDFFTLNCPSCGGRLDVDPNTSVLKCPYCGAEHFVRREGRGVSLESYARCPKCGRNDRVEKVTSILRSQPKDSGLAVSLAPPERQAATPKPRPLPKPGLTPKPKPLPKPGITARPVITFRKKNNWFIIGGFGLFSIFYLAVFIFLGMSFDPSLRWSIICSGASLIPLVLGLILIFRGHSGVKETFDDAASLKSQVNRRQGDPAKQKSRFTVISIIFFVIASLFIIISLLAFIDNTEILIPLLGFSTLPAMFGIYFWVRRRSAGKKDSAEYPSIAAYETALRNWEAENDKLQQDWAQENARLMSQWEAENARVLESWEKENKRRFQAWKERNDQIPQRYRDVMERWEELYFCHRDDVVFIPGEGTFAPVEKMNAYLQGEAP